MAKPDGNLSSFLSLDWLPAIADLESRLIELDQSKIGREEKLVSLANANLNRYEVVALDRKVREIFCSDSGRAAFPGSARLAIFGSGAIEHLLPSIRVGGLRRGVWVDVSAFPNGQHYQQLLDQKSELFAFDPTHILFSFDASYLISRGESAQSVCRDSVPDAVLSYLVELWKSVRQRYNCPIIQQTALPTFPLLIGNNEYRLKSSSAYIIDEVNYRIRSLARAEKIDLLAVDSWAAREGISAWHDPAVWNFGKIDIVPRAAPFYGDLVGRLLGAQLGRSCKCVVLDLDDTIWGGTVGEDGVDGIFIGPGTALGEAFASFQRYLKALTDQGILLAVCSKNDEKLALQVFSDHSEMILKRSDIACFVANWNDKATNISKIASDLNLSLDSFVFVDNSPAERELVRKALPQVRVPEIPLDPALFAYSLAKAGYFESVVLTSEDLSRSRSYQAKLLREGVEKISSNVNEYLESLAMVLRITSFQREDLARLTQLVNKTNQFNCTLRRYTEQELSSICEDEKHFVLQLRLQDRFEDYGLIALVIAHMSSDMAAMVIDCWVMSCRVFGRGVEYETLNALAGIARMRSAKQLVVPFSKSERNEPALRALNDLGFRATTPGANGASIYSIRLKDRLSIATQMTVQNDTYT